MDKLVRVHIRRCHCCNEVIESAGPITKCSTCGKGMAPFYFFNDIDTPALSDIETREDLAVFVRPGERSPLRGFTAYW